MLSVKSAAYPADTLQGAIDGTTPFVGSPDLKSLLQADQYDHIVLLQQDIGDPLST